MYFVNDIVDLMWVWIIMYFLKWVFDIINIVDDGLLKIYVGVNLKEFKL